MKSILEYKGYLGSAEVSLEDNILHGKLMYIRDVVNYAADTPQELYSAFQDAVDDYIQTCLECGDEPNVPFKGVFNVRFPPELHRECAIAALKENVTLNDWVKASCKSRIAHNKTEIHHHHELKVILQNESEVSVEINEYDFESMEPSWQPQLQH